MAPVAPIVGGIENGPLDFVAPVVCCFGSLFGGPAVLLLLAFLGRRAGRRTWSRERAVLTGAGVGALLGILAFNVTFLVLIWNDRDVWRPTEHGLGEEAVAQVRKAVAGHVVCFSVTGGTLGCVFGMLIFGAYVRPPEPVAPAPSTDADPPPAGSGPPLH